MASEFPHVFMQEKRRGNDETIAEIEWKLNNRPRKSLDYLTSIGYCKKFFILALNCTIWNSHLH